MKSCFLSSAVHLSEYDVLGTDNCHNIGQHVASRHFIQTRQVCKARCTDFQTIRLVGTIGHQIDAKLTLGMLDRRIGLALG